MPYLSVLGGGERTHRSHRSLLCVEKIFQRSAFIAVDTQPLAELNRLSFVVILRIVSGKLELWTAPYTKKKKEITDTGLKWTHVINMAVVLKWNVANGGGEGWQWIRDRLGWGDVAMALRAWACLDGTAHPLPLCLCSCVSHCLPACNFPSTVTVWAHRHPVNF